MPSQRTAGLSLPKLKTPFLWKAMKLRKISPFGRNDKFTATAPSRKPHCRAPLCPSVTCDFGHEKAVRVQALRKQFSAMQRDDKMKFS
jgi:hypothetical protein